MWGKSIVASTFTLSLFVNPALKPYSGSVCLTRKSRGERIAIANWVADRRTGLAANLKYSATRFSRQKNVVDNPHNRKRHTCQNIDKCMRELQHNVQFEPTCTTYIIVQFQYIILYVKLYTTIVHISQ